MLCIKCGKDRLIRSKGMCSPCYVLNYRNTTKIGRDTELRWRRTKKAQKCNSKNLKLFVERHGIEYFLIRIREWSKNNPEKVRNHSKKYYLEHKDEIIKQRKNFRDSHPGYISNYIRKRKKVDKVFAIICRLWDRKNKAIRQAIKVGKIPEDYIFMGTKIEYKKIIEFLNPIPKNWRELHIDEKFPYCKVDWNDIKSIKKCLAPENHQWLTPQENLRKGSKYKFEFD